MRHKTIKSFLLNLKELSEDTYISELKGYEKLTEEEDSYLRTIIGGIQNELGEMDIELFNKFKVKPYTS